VPPLPATAANQPPRSLRDQLQMHSSDPTCAACHKLMDPLGLAFENYSPVGQYVTTFKGLPVVATGALQGAGTVDGPVTDAVDLMTKLAASPAVWQCMSKFAMDFGLARVQEPGAVACTSAAVARKFSESKGSFKELFKAIFVSDLFLDRPIAKIKVEKAKP
jgi:hypothetical protein